MRFLFALILCVSIFSVSATLYGGNDSKSSSRREKSSRDQKKKSDKDKDKDKVQLSSRDQTNIKSISESFPKMRAAYEFLKNAKANNPDALNSNDAVKAQQYIRGVSRRFETAIVMPFKSDLQKYFRTEEEFQAKKNSNARNLDKYEKIAQKNWDRVMLFKPVLVDFYNSGGILDPAVEKFLLDENFVKPREEDEELSEEGAEKKKTRTKREKKQNKDKEQSQVEEESNLESEKD